MVSMFVFFCCFGLAMVIGLVGFTLTPAAVGQYARTNEIGAGYRWSEVRCVLRANAAGFFLAWLLYWGALAFFYLLFMVLYYTVVLCVFVPFLTAPLAFYLALMFAQFFGAAYREGALKAGVMTA
jgi:hypothetical protein